MVEACETTIPPEEASPRAQQMSVLGLDMAKPVLHGVEMDHTEPVVLRKRLARRCSGPSGRRFSPWENE
jgi:hypothetical protein